MSNSNKNRVTQAQIAERAGVCQATVSLVLSGRENASVQPETYERIITAAQELGYRRVSTVKTGEARTGNIALLIPEMHNTENGHHFIRRFNTGVLQALKGKNYQVMQAIISDQDVIPDLIRQGKVDGVIIINECRPSWVRRVSETIPTVWLNAFDCLTPVDSVMPENYEGIFQGIKHLYDLGHRQIAYFNGAKLCLQTTERLKGYHMAMEALGLPVREEYLALYEEHWKENHEDMKVILTGALEKLLRLPEPPTAIIAPSDWDIAVMLRAAHSMGLTLPRDLSLVGYDNMDFCDLLYPRLTSIYQPMELMGAQACRLLLKRISGVDNPVTTVRYGVKLILRDSTAPPPVISPRMKQAVGAGL